MIAHIVLLEPRADLTEGERRAIAAELAAAARSIPSVRRFRVGRRVLLGGLDYERAAPPYTWFAIAEFDDRAGLAQYLAHPAHQAVGAHFRSAASSAAAYDVELVEGEDVEGILGG